MKKITKKQMKKLKGMLDDMDYNLNDPTNLTTIPTPDTTDPQSNICKVSAVVSDK
jgi:hypothetical protein